MNLHFFTKKRVNDILQKTSKFVKRVGFYKMDKIKNQLAGVAALLGVIAAIGGGFVKYGEIVTKLDALESLLVVKIGLHK